MNNDIAIASKLVASMASTAHGRAETPPALEPLRRMAHAARAALLYTGAMLATTTQANVVDIAWNAGGGFNYEGRIEPGKFAEVCGKVQRGQAIAWRYKADKPLEFNIHYHVGKDVVYPTRKTAATLRGKLSIASNEDHCWMWTNKSDAPVALSLGLQKR